MPHQSAVALAMTDEDVVSRAALLLEARYLTLPRRQEHHKVVHVTRLRGRRAIETMEALRPHMGRRRRQQIDTALQAAGPHTKRVPYAAEIAEMVSLRQGGAGRRWLAERYGVGPKSVDRQLRDGARPIAAMLTLASEVAAVEAQLDAATSGNPETAWLAGLVEGEGCFSGGVARVKMTDRDIVQRVAEQFGAKLRYQPPRRPGWSPTWETATTTTAGREIAHRLRPALGVRRQGQVDSMAISFVSVTGKRGVSPERLARNQEIARRVLAGETGPALAVEYGVTHQNIYFIAKTYRDLVECPRG
jgi:hypothetical protein